MSRIVTYDAYGNEVEDDDGLFNGGTAEDWYNAYTELVHGKGIIERALERDIRRVSTELKDARQALEHQKKMRKRAESMLADMANSDITSLSELVESLREENAELRKTLLAVREALE